MEFKKFSAGFYSYGKSDSKLDPILLKQKGITNVNFEDPTLEEHLRDPNHENAFFLEKFFEILSICHTIVAEKKNGEVFYNSSSPDELALVNAAKYFNWVFVGRDEDDTVIIKVNGSDRKYQLLNVIEFTSARKRMTIIVKDEDGKIIVMCKGADNIMAPRLLASCSDHLN